MLQSRHIRIRERDGTLRTATAAEHERYNQEFFAEPHKRISAPDMCSEAELPETLRLNGHKFALDLVVKHLHPYQSDYRRVSSADSFYMCTSVSMRVCAHMTTASTHTPTHPHTHTHTHRYVH